MSYPVRIMSGTDNLIIPGDRRVYTVGDVITSLSDETRLSLQRSGIRFEAVHDDTPPAPTAADAAPEIPPDQRALNDEIAQAKADEQPAKKGKA